MSFMKPDSFLRRSLMGNATFSTLTGLTCILFPADVSESLGLTGKAESELLLLGIALIGFAATLFSLASSLFNVNQKPLIAAAKIIIAADGLWVLGSIILMATSLLPLNAFGMWTVAIVALFVLDFAILQTIGLHRLTAAAL
jgi:hypothetical protein